MLQGGLAVGCHDFTASCARFQLAVKRSGRFTVLFAASTTQQICSYCWEMYDPQFHSPSKWSHTSKEPASVFWKVPCKCNDWHCSYCLITSCRLWLQHPQLQEIPVFLWGGTAGRITLSPRTQTVVISRQTYVRAERVTLLPRCISSQDPAGAQHCYQTIKIFCNFSSPSTDTGCKICLVMFIGATNRTI